MIRFLRRLTLALLLLIVCAHVRADETRRTLAQGIVYVQETQASAAGPLSFNVLRVDLKRVRVQTGIGRDVILNDEPANGRETIGALSARYHAVAAVNGDFFPYTGDPVGIAIRDGELLSESMPNRVAIGLGRDGSAVFDTLLTVGTLYAADGSVTGLDGINRLVGKDELILLTPSFGLKARCPLNSVCAVIASAALPVKVGQNSEGIAAEPAAGNANQYIPDGSCVLVGTGTQAAWMMEHIHANDKTKFRFDFISNPLPPGPSRGNLASRSAALKGRPLRSVWTEVDQAIGGGPWLVRDGRTAIDGEEEAFTERGFITSRHPRTAAGVTREGELLLVTVDGRQDFSIGMSLPELAGYMLKLGAVNAINLDGGGSTTMVAKDLYVNGPSDGEPRAVADGLLFFAREEIDPQSAPQPPDQILASVKITAGQKLNVALPENVVVEGETPLWGTVEGRAFVSQHGLLSGIHAGAGTVSAQTNAGTIRIPYVIEPAAPATLNAILSASPNNPPDRNILTVSVTDAYKNRIKGQTVKLSVFGGTAEKTEVITDSSGRASVEIVWDVETNRRVTVSSGVLPPISLRSK